MSKRNIGPIVVFVLIMGVVLAAFFFFVVLKKEVNKDFSPTPIRHSGKADKNLYCSEFVAFTFGCGIARPEIDPAKPIAPQRIRNRQVQERLANNCLAQRAPYAPRLIDCYLQAGGFCDAYQECVNAN